jgi:hypothetical protein
VGDVGSSSDEFVDPMEAWASAYISASWAEAPGDSILGQRIAIFRAFMRAKRPEVDLLVFDEPVSQARLLASTAS